MTAISPLFPSEGPAASSPDDPADDGRTVTAAPPGVPLRDRVISAGVVLVLLAVLGATATWRVLDDDPVGGDDAASTAPAPAPGGTATAPGTTDPDEWGVELEPLVEFVERERGGPFDRPVPVEYLDEDEYRDSVTAQTDDTTPEDDAELAAWEGQLRALGLLAPDADVDQALDQIYGEGTLAYYDDQEEVIRVRGTRLDVAHQVTLVHELTHAWQDQQGYLDGWDELDDTAGFVLQNLAEGDASRIEDRFVDTLSPSELDDYFDQSQDQAGGVDLDGVPDSLLAVFTSPYALGGRFVDLLDALGGNGEVDAAFETLPLAEADLMVPQRYLDGAIPEEVPQPSVPEGAEVLDDGPFGAVGWLLVLSERVDPREALGVVDAWSGDHSVVYRADGRVCTAVAYRGTTPADTDAARDLMAVWAAASGLDATVDRTAEDASVRSCEPGGDSEPVGRSQTALGYPTIRLEAMVEYLDEGYDIDAAACFGSALVDQLSVEQVEDGALYDADAARPLVDAARRACPD